MSDFLLYIIENEYDEQSKKYLQQPLKNDINNQLKLLQNIKPYEKYSKESLRQDNNEININMIDVKYNYYDLNHNYLLLKQCDLNIYLNELLI